MNDHVIKIRPSEHLCKSNRSENWPDVVPIPIDLWTIFHFILFFCTKQKNLKLGRIASGKKISESYSEIIHRATSFPRHLSHNCKYSLCGCFVWLGRNRCLCSYPSPQNLDLNQGRSSRCISMLSSHDLFLASLALITMDEELYYESKPHVAYLPYMASLSSFVHPYFHELC